MDWCYLDTSSNGITFVLLSASWICGMGDRVDGRSVTIGAWSLSGMSQKQQLTVHKHGVSFEKAKTVFDNLVAVIFNDQAHSVGEKREIPLILPAIAFIVLITAEMYADRIQVMCECSRLLGAGDGEHWAAFSYQF